MDNKEFNKIDDLILKEFDNVTLPEGLKSENLLKLIKDVTPDEEYNEEYILADVSEDEHLKLVLDNTKEHTAIKKTKTPFAKLIAPYAYAAAFMAIIGGMYHFSGAGSAITTPEQSPMLIEEAPQRAQIRMADPESVPENDAELSTETSLRSPQSFEELVSYIAEYNTYEEPEYLMSENKSEGFFGFLDDGVALEESTADAAPPLSSSAPNPPTAGLGESAETITTEDSTSNSADYSGTNNQVAAVDEGDIIKTNGDYIFRVNFKGDIVIIDPDKMEVVSEIASVNGDYAYKDVQDIFIYEDTLTIIFTGNTVENLTRDVYNFGVAQRTGVEVYDISDAENPKLDKEYTVSANYRHSRMYDGHIYMVSSTYLNSYTEEQYKDILPEDVMPIITNDGEFSVMPINDICILPTDMPYNYTIITAINLDDTSDVENKALLGDGDELYMSEDHIYITGEQYYNDTVSIAKVKVDGTEITPLASGAVDGYIESQFSMDEHEGYFRIATTSWSEGESINNMYILDENLELAGKVEGMAPGERIYSVRFMGDMGYVVTFKETDPLFAIDLSDPKNPKVLGELKIPGFSEYMHPIDEDTLIGFGVNTILDSYGNVVEKGLKLSLFDVSDPTQPKESSNFILGDMYSYSPALYDHKAVYYNGSKMLFGFPAELYSVTEKSDSSGFYMDSNMSFMGYMLLNVDKEEGFSVAASLDTVTSVPDRALHIGEYIYTSSGSDLNKYSFSTYDLIDSVNY